MINFSIEFLNDLKSVINSQPYKEKLKYLFVYVNAITNAINFIKRILNSLKIYLILENFLI